MSGESVILTINGGSSSVKFAGYSKTDLRRLFGGRIERIGSDNARLIVDGEERAVAAQSAGDAARQIVDYIKGRLGPAAVAAIGHRVVHGGLHLLEHQQITPDVIEGPENGTGAITQGHSPFFEGRPAIR